MARTSDPDDPQYHRRQARINVRYLINRLLDDGWQPGEIQQHPQVVYWHGLAYVPEVIQRSHLRNLVADIRGEPGDQLPRRHSSRLVAKQLSLDGLSGGGMEWESLSEKQLIADPDAQRDVMLAIHEGYQRRMERAPRVGLRYRHVRKQIAETRKAIENT